MTLSFHWAIFLAAAGKRQPLGVFPTPGCPQLVTALGADVAFASWFLCDLTPEPPQSEEAPGGVFFSG